MPGLYSEVLPALVPWKSDSEAFVPEWLEQQQELTVSTHWMKKKDYNFVHSDDLALLHNVVRRKRFLRFHLLSPENLATYHQYSVMPCK